MSDYQNHDDAYEKFIIRPQKAKVGCKFDTWVTKHSPKWQRKCFVQLKRYLAIECRLCVDMDTSDEFWEYIEILSLTDEFYDVKRGELRQWLIGAVAFTNEPNYTELEFCWVHPFCRKNRLLKGKWPLLQKRFGSFSIHEPRSKAMQDYLKSVGYIEQTMTKTLVEKTL